MSTPSDIQEFYRSFAQKHDLSFRPLQNTWYKLVGHGLTVDIRLDTSTGGEVITIMTHGPFKTAEHMAIAAIEWRKAKK